MSDKRVKQLVYLGIVVVLGIVHLLWGKPIFSFLASTVFYWLFAAAILVVFCDAIFSLIKNKDVNFEAKIEKASIFVSDWEREGNPLPPRKKEEIPDVEKDKTSEDASETSAKEPENASEDAPAE